ncbi:MAG: peptide deformylase [Oscillospiraceae bacterium]|nr:peptide deformylase [Oscillospiraceae bacterium]
MAIRKVLQVGDPALRKVSRPVEEFGRKLHQLLDDMYATMQKEDGCGLAAAQVGVLRRAVVIDMGENDEDGLMELVNPVILSMSGEAEGKEGCLSVKGKRGFVTRPQKVKFRAQDRFGNWYEKIVKDRKAVAVQHEVDHLNGILYIDKMTRYVTPEEEEQDAKEDE